MSVLFFTGPGDEDPDVLFEAGPKDDLDAALCAALAPWAWSAWAAAVSAQDDAEPRAHGRSGVAR